MNAINNLRTISNTERLEAGIDLRDYFDLIKDARWRIIAITLLVAASVGVYMLLTPPAFKADALIKVDQPNTFVELVRRQETPPALQEEDPMYDEQEVLSSRAVLGKVVATLGLQIEAHPEWFPVIGAAIARWRAPQRGLSPPLFKLRQYAWSGEKIRVKTFAVPKWLQGKRFAVIAEGERQYRLLGPNGALLLKGRLGTQAKVVLNHGHQLRVLISKLVAHPGNRFVLIQHSRLDAIEMLRDALTITRIDEDSHILKVEFKSPKPGLSARVVNEIATEYVHNNIKWNSVEAQQKLHFLHSQLPALKARVEDSEAALTAYRKQQSAVDLPLETKAAVEQIAARETQLAKLKQERAALLLKFTPNSLSVVTLDARANQIKAGLRNLEQNFVNLPDAQRELLRLTRNVEVNTTLYTGLLKSAQEQRVARAGMVANVRVLDHAMRPEHPAGPSPALLLTAGSTFGMFLGLAVVFTRNSLRREVVDNPDLVENQLRLPVYATIPHSPRQKKLKRLRRRPHGVLADLHPDDLSVESLRSLRATLHDVLAGAPNNILMVCSPRDGMGKSFVCANLGALLAGAGERVLLMDADLRSGRLHEVFKVPCEPGLSGFLSARVNYPVHQTAIDRLLFIARGKYVSQPSELLLRGRLGEELDRLSEQYDHIIVDSPPVLSVADAAAIAGHAGATIMVIKAEVTTLRELERSAQLLQRAGGNLRGFLLNDINPRSRHYGYGYYGYNAA